MDLEKCSISHATVMCEHELSQNRSTHKYDGSVLFMNVRIFDTMYVQYGAAHSQDNLYIRRFVPDVDSTYSIVPLKCIFAPVLFTRIFTRACPRENSSKSTSENTRQGTILGYRPVGSTLWMKILLHTEVESQGTIQ